MSTVIDGIDFGPIAGLVGTWQGDRGVDIAPEPDGIEENPYYETLKISVVGDVTNAEEQILAVLTYHQQVSRKSNDKVFHDQIGYFIWDAATDTVMHSLSIPRGVTLLAGGEARQEGAETVITLRAADGDADWGVAQSPFMRDKARTVEFLQTLRLNGDSLSYQQTTVLDIYGRSFDHTDTSELQRV